MFFPLPPFLLSCFCESTFSLFCLSKPAFCLSLLCFTFLHIYLEWKGRSWKSLLPGTGVCAAGPPSQRRLSCQLWHEGCPEVQGVHRHRGQQERQRISTRTPAWRCAVQRGARFEELASTMGGGQARAFKTIFIGACQMAWFPGE